MLSYPILSCCSVPYPILLSPAQYFVRPRWSVPRYATCFAPRILGSGVHNVSCAKGFRFRGTQRSVRPGFLAPRYTNFGAQLGSCSEVHTLSYSPTDGLHNIRNCGIRIFIILARWCRGTPSPQTTPLTEIIPVHSL